jgi:hypothetical protein
MLKIRVRVAVSEDQDGRPIVHYDIEENGVTMEQVAILIYKIKQIEQELIDREWKGDGYSIADDKPFGVGE